MAVARPSNISATQPRVHGGIAAGGWWGKSRAARMAKLIASANSKFERRWTVGLTSNRIGCPTETLSRAISEALKEVHILDASTRDHKKASTCPHQGHDVEGDGIKDRHAHLICEGS